MLFSHIIYDKWEKWTVHLKSTRHRIKCVTVRPHSVFVSDGVLTGFLCLAIYIVVSWAQYRSNSNYGNRNLRRGQCDGLHLASLYKDSRIDSSNSQHL